MQEFGSKRPIDGPKRAQQSNCLVWREEDSRANTRAGKIFWLKAFGIGGCVRHRTRLALENMFLEMPVLVLSTRS